MNTMKNGDEQTEGILDEQPIEELFLLHLRYKEAQLVEAGSNHPILLNDKNLAWVVYSGRVDVFAVELADGRVAGPRIHLFRVEAGQALWGMDFARSGGKIGLLAVGNKDTRLLKVRANRLQALSQDEEFCLPVVTMLERWVAQLSHCLSSTLPPKDCLNLEAGQDTAVTSHSHASTRRGIVWVEHIEGKSYFMSQPQFAVNGQGYTPLSTHTWIETTGDCHIRVQETAGFLTDDPAWSALADFHQLVLEHVWQSARRKDQDDQKQLQNRIITNQDTLHTALARLAAPFPHQTIKILLRGGKKFSCRPALWWQKNWALHL